MDPYVASPHWHGLITAYFFLGGIACILGGVLSDRFIRRTGNRTLGRKLYGMIGYAGCCLAYIAAIFNHNSPYILIGCLAMVGFFSDLTLGPAWATAQDIGKRYAAIILHLDNESAIIRERLGLD